MVFNAGVEFMPLVGLSSSWESIAGISDESNVVFVGSICERKRNTSQAGGTLPPL